MLPEVVGDDEALGGRRLDEHGLEVDLLWPSIDLLQLLASEFHTAVSDLSLRLRLSLPLSLDNPVLVSLSAVAQSGQVGLSGLVTVNWLLYVEEVDLSWQSQFW